MREFNEGCFFTKTYSDGQKVESLLELKVFLNSESERKRLGVPQLSTLDRIQIVADMLGTLAKLHQQGLVVGDLSGSNLLLQRKASRMGAVRVLFLDVDSFWFGGVSHPSGPESTLHWRSPEELEISSLPPSKATDVYKAALLIRRLMHQDANTGSASYDIYNSRISNQALERIGGATLTKLISAALNSKITARPKAMELAYHFKAAADNLAKGVSK
jgi:serine/threonine protein kinase